MLVIAKLEKQRFGRAVSIVGGFSNLYDNFNSITAVRRTLFFVSSM